MPAVQANGITLEYDEQGAGPPLLLIMGLAGQLTDWSEPFVSSLAKNFRVIRFDNRDAGLSTEIRGSTPTRLDFTRAVVQPKSTPKEYALDDMADDAAGLLEALGIGRAHVVGMSMGGMIAQLVAIRHPNRVASLCSIMANTGSRLVGRPTPRVLAKIVLARQKPTVDQAFAESMALLKLVAGADWDADASARQARASIARSFRPEGVLRQSLAIATAADRTARLKAVEVPTLVVHGLDDTLVHPSGGMATAKAIGHAQLLMLPRMGHHIPASRAGQIAEAITDLAKLVPTTAFTAS